MSVLPSLSPPSKRTSARPLKPSTGVSAMRPSTTLTTPPIAPEPYSRVEGPLSTSIWLARNGSIAGEWSWLTVETSCVERPSRSTATRGPSRPRMIGRPTPGPEVGTLHARQAGHRLAQAGGAHFVQALACQHLDRAAQLAGGIAQRAGGDHHLVQVLDMAAAGRRRVMPGIGTGRGLRVGRHRGVVGHGQSGDQHTGQGQREGGAAERGGKAGGHG